MHKIKTQARRHAWYGADIETTRNPFSKRVLSNVSSRTSDLESGMMRPHLGRSTSESQFPSEIEQRRQSRAGLGNFDRTMSDQEPARATGAQMPRSSTGGMRDPLPPLTSESQSPRSPDFSTGEPSGVDKTGDAGRNKQDTRQDNEKTTRSGVSGDSNGTDSSYAAPKGADTNYGLAEAPTHELVQYPESSKRTLASFFRLRRRKTRGGNREDGDRNGDDQLRQTDTATSKPKKQHPPFTVRSQIQNTIFNSPINILLVAVPIGIALNYALPNKPEAIFAVNFIAIIPLAAMLSYATEEIAMRTGETIGGLLNASFGNATELIVSIIALFKGEIVITQTSLIGSMLSNLLLVMGMCFFFGGLNREKQCFNVTVAQTAASLLALALAGLIVPTIFDVQTLNNETTTIDIVSISRGVSILLLIVYALYLLFQLYTHSDIYNAPSEKVPKRSPDKGETNRITAGIGSMLHMMAPDGARENLRPQNEDDDDDEEVPKLHILVAIATLAISTAFIALCSDYLVSSISAITDRSEGISKTFVGLILLPIVGNAAEHATAVTVAVKDKMDLAIGVAVGSSMQIALLVLPLVVVIAWIGGIDEMTLDFDTFQVVILFISILLVNYLIADGESHWLEGAQLMILYIIIALASWYYPQPCSPSSQYCPPSGGASA